MHTILPYSVRRLLQVGLFSLLLTPFAYTETAHSQTQQGNGPQADPGQGESINWIIEKLKTAKPAPTPPGIGYDSEETASPEQNREITRDMSSGEVQIADPQPAEAPDDAQQTPASPGLLPLQSSPDTQSEGKDTSVTPAAPWPEGEDGTTPPNATDATPPSLLLETTAAPWNTVHKLLMEFYSSESGAYHYYVCSAFAVGSFQLGTAGHCIYNFDPNDDGSTADASWATNVWAWAAQTDRVEPFSVEDFPYGVARATYIRSYTGWTNSQNFDHDWAVITLDRRQGDHTGWMGRESGVTTSALNFTGYPVETPYVPFGAIGQYPGYDANNITSYSTYRINLAAFIYGGHSGGPSWRYLAPDRFIQGIHSTSNRVGSATDTRLTANKMTSINDYIADDATNRPPIARPNLIEYWFDTAAKVLITPLVPLGGTLQVEYNVLNAGFAAASNVDIDFYLSTNDIISTGDYYIGTASRASLSAYTFHNSIAALTVPASVPLGNYYVGWLVSTSTTEYNTDDNAIVITSELVTVGAAACTPDTHEPNNSSGAAGTVLLNTSQTHNICPADDEDWTTFTLTSESEVVLSTSGASGDTRLWLYNSSLSEIAFNDDGGTNLFSSITRSCGVNALPAGTYYVKVDEFGNDNEIDSYNLNLATSTCVIAPADIRVEPQLLSFIEPTPMAENEAASAARLASAVPATGIDNRDIKLRNGTVSPYITNSRHSQETLGPDGRRHMLMQFGRMPTSGDKLALRQQGIEVLSYIPNQAYWVSADNIAPASVSASGGISWAWVPPAAHKLSPRIVAGDLPPNTVHPDGTISVTVQVFDDVRPSQVRQVINSLGAGVRVSAVLGEALYEVRLPPARAREVASLDEVRWVEPAAPPRAATNVVAASRITADTLQQSPFNLDGSGVTVGVWDGGSVDPHIDFDSRLTVVDAVAPHYHSTHVAGTVGGSGLGDSSAMGMAPGVTLRSYEWTNDTTEMRNAATNNSVVISNHSYGLITGWHYNGGWIDYGAGGFGLYDTSVAEFDDIAYDTGLLIFKSAGNERNDGPGQPACTDPTQCDGPYDSIGYIGNGKNIVTICALEDNDTMSSFSSWGPSNDGRVKPDLCANGVGLNSTDLNDAYLSISGTSMSTPSAAGAAALLFERFLAIHSSSPQPALLKTLMIHGANDTFNTGPDYQSGWGIIDAATTLGLIDSTAFKTGSIAATSSQMTFPISHSGGTLKATLGWTDPAGSPAASTALVNDLNLTLVAPGGAVHYPWVLDGNNPTAAATTGVNSVDNIEQVEVSGAAAGIWTAVVTGFAVPMGPQVFHLVADGINDSEVKAFIVYNDGEATLDVSSIVPATTAPWISIIPSTLSLGGGQSAAVNVTVDYALAPEGTTVINLVVNSNDTDEQPYPGGVDISVTKNTASCPDNDNDGLCDDVDPDDDNDGMTDIYELANGLNPLVDDAGGDADSDGLTNLEEFILGTLANNPDSDGDGVSDGDEVDYGTDPLDSADCPAWACSPKGSWRYKLLVP